MFVNTKITNFFIIIPLPPPIYITITIILFLGTPAP
jgi:hypothetical protein